MNSNDLEMIREVVEKYRLENKELREVLKSVEWVPDTYNDTEFCACCGIDKEDGHENTCKVFRLLSKKGE